MTSAMRDFFREREESKWEGSEEGSEPTLELRTGDRVRMQRRPMALLPGQIFLQREASGAEKSAEEDDGIIRDDELEEGARNKVLLANRAKSGVRELKGDDLSTDDLFSLSEHVPDDTSRQTQSGRCDVICVNCYEVVRANEVDDHSKKC